MPAPVDFYFDFSSPYAYLASEKIDALAAAHGREVVWRPILLGGVFQALGTVSLVKQTDKADYSVRDIARSARYLGVPYRMPSRFPVPTQTAGRAFYWLDEQDRALARRYAHAVFRAYYVDDRDISAPEVALAVAGECGIDSAALTAALERPEVKARLKEATEAAVAAGVFGAPHVVIDGEPFWGADRLPQIEKWLQTGGF
jgi:2-hydroxychromene-2-carboxylate isomerase